MHLIVEYEPMNNLKRKWEWIKEKCEEHNLTEAAEIAGEIDDLLNKLYEGRHPTMWRLEGGKPTQSTLAGVALNGAYCIACSEHSGDCDKCLYGAKAGICVNEAPSLYSKFFEALPKEGILL